jgi:hypothetical protein
MDGALGVFQKVTDIMQQDLQLAQPTQMNKKEKESNGALGVFQPRPDNFLTIFIQP